MSIRILTFSTLYPNASQPRHGIFVEQRLRKLVASKAVTARVMAPVPWVPVDARLFGSYAAYARVPRTASRHGIDIVHPRYPVIPKVGMTVAPWLMAAAVWPSLKRLMRSGYDFDLIDAHYFYPDGVAASMLARLAGKPFVVTSRGTDVNLIPRYALPRRMILAAADKAAGLVTVSQALKDGLVDLGVADERVTVLRNGVDLEFFKPMARADARADTGWTGRRLLSVGHLIERKGHHLIIEALNQLPDCHLVIAGDGPMDAELESLARRLGVADRVTFLGAVDQSRLPLLYCAADALVLASSREGMANVPLEAIACGLPVVATPIWGTPEVIAAPEAGVLTRDRSAPALVEAVNSLFADYPDRARTRAYAERFSWDATTEGQLALFERVIGRAAGAATPGGKDTENSMQEEACQ